MPPKPDLDAELERMRLRRSQATAKSGQAFLRLLRLAETQDSGQTGRVVKFLASTYNGEAFPYDLFDLRTVDGDISDDMILCIDALRWGQADLHTLVPDGDRRMKSILESWGLKWPQSH
jgi:hypothetical protein